jgi:hypothetical protein
MALSDGPAAFSAVMDAMFAPDGIPVARDDGKGNPAGRRFRGDHAKIDRQLYRGFIDAGRPDLARLVGTKDFNAWVNAESGFRPDVVSQYYAEHGVNYGLFQFWEGHDWTKPYVEGNSFTATPYQQAKLVAKYFDLTPGEVHTYADQIRAGTYQGWG